jgi:starch synthase
MHIVFAASECAPWAKTGGLADVVRALPHTLAKLGHKVSVFIPYYRQVAKGVPNPAVVLPSVTIPFPSYNRFVRVLNGGVDAGVQTYFIDCPELFDREGFYATRNASVCLAARSLKPQR